MPLFQFQEYLVYDSRSTHSSCVYFLCRNIISLQGGALTLGTFSLYFITYSILCIAVTTQHKLGEFHVKKSLGRKIQWCAFLSIHCCRGNRFKTFVIGGGKSWRVCARSRVSALIFFCFRMFTVYISRRIDMQKIILLFLVTVFVKSAPKNGDLYLWIDEQQVKMFSGE